MKQEQLKDYTAHWIQQNKRDFFVLADYIWENPELGLEEYKASAAIKKLLCAHGFSISSGQGGMPTAFVASYGTEGPAVGINVEYDCLPGLSQKKDVPYPCPVIDGAPGHGCGHNILGTAGVLAGVALRHAIEDLGLKCRVNLLGSPYEEASVGKALIARDGVYSAMDFIIDWHPSDKNFAYYDRCNSVFVLELTFHGKSSHGMTPWHGRSALDAAMLFGHAVEVLREHIYPNTPESPNTINYTFTDCGPRFANIVPNTTTVQLYGRFHDMPASRDGLERIKQCAQGAAMATQTTVDVQFITYTHNKIPNKVLAEVVHQNLQLYGVPQFTEKEMQFVKTLEKNAGLPPVGLSQTIEPFGPAETGICDTSEMAWNAPYATFNLAMAPGGGWHNWMVTACAGNSIGKRTMLRAAEILAASAIDIVCDPAVIPAAKKEWKAQLNGETYQCLLPEGHMAPLGINRETMEKYFPRHTEE